MICLRCSGCTTLHPLRPPLLSLSPGHPHPPLSSLSHGDFWDRENENSYAIKKTATQQRADRSEDLAGPLSLPRAAVEGAAFERAFSGEPPTLAGQPFADPAPLHELTFPRALDAKRAMADHLALPLAKLAPEQLGALHALREEPLAKHSVWDHVRRHLEPLYRREEGHDHAQRRHGALWPQQAPACGGI